jgi:hypothetical protein
LIVEADLRPVVGV